MANEQKPRKEPTAIDDGKLRLYGAPIKEGARGTMFRLKKVENNPVLEADSGTKTEPKNGRDGYPIKIETPMAPRPFRRLMNLIISVAKFKGATEFEMENWGHPFIYDKEKGGNVRSKDRLIISRFQVAKREDGVVTFAVSAKGRDTLSWEFRGDEFHKVQQKGQPVDEGTDSAQSAIAWAESLIDVYFHHFTANWAEPEFQRRRRLENMQNAQNRGGNNQGQRQQYNGNSGGGNNQAPRQQGQQPAAQMDDSFDDDIPF